MSIPPSQTPVPHDLLWFPGGDVVLSTDTLLFKVHKDVLSLQSSFFKDTFDFFAVRDAQMANDGSGSAEETYEGIPVMRMVGDEGTDVVHLLRTVYERQYYRRDDPKTPLATMVALFNLNTKYDFKHIRTDVIFQISKEYPTQLDAYDDWCDCGYPIFGEMREYMYAHFTLLKMLFKANVPGLLPVIYYASSCSPYSDIFTMTATLDAECLSTLIKGKEKLILAANSVIGDLPDLVRDVVIKCNEDCQYEVRITKLSYVLDYADLRQMRGDFVMQQCVNGVCGKCSKKIEAEYDKRRADVWEKIPSLFGYESWIKTRQEIAEACT
ncbi:hypothetical protein SCHPADRAFT_908662 [Schizopora paradoxa]|uniref:BTB domain-containing protein n=1 Tax=Schizopora paradoxa TaxID=27342 RepID=A0A0H2RFW8_9AGAM|nr:hypothetical protein SCHPADRAFT_908662 [Schizopora paradoxa]